MAHPDYLRISWIYSFMFGALLVIISLSRVDAYPQPCRFPRQYEGRRFQSTYFDVKEEYVAIDCVRKLMYTTNVGRKDNSRFRIVDMERSVMYIFNRGRECVVAPMPKFEIVDYCETSKKASFTGSMTLKGKVREGWVTTNPRNYEQTTVITRSEKKGEGCLPFLFRVRSDGHILMANTFYDVKRGISDVNARRRLKLDTSRCSNLGLLK